MYDYILHVVHVICLFILFILAYSPNPRKKLYVNLEFKFHSFTCIDLNSIKVAFHINFMHCEFFQL